jgi:hypothetical protein
MRTIANISQIPYINLSLDAQQSVARRAEERKKLNDRTLMGGDGNATGFTGEELIKAHLPAFRQDPENRNYDFFMDFKFSGGIDANGETYLISDVEPPSRFTFDVKSRRIKVAPRLNFDCKIPAYQVKRQKCDAYIFTAPHESMQGGWLLGWTTKERFLKVAKLFKKGYKHPSGIILKEDHYFITVTDLFPIADLAGTAKSFSIGSEV